MKPHSLIALLALTAASALSHAVEMKPYSMAAVQEAQQAGKPYAIHFHADWCSTCHAQEKVLQSLKDDKEVNLLVYVANYDQEKDMKQQHRVRWQSTLIVFQGTEEKARLTGDTRSDSIKSALKKAF